MAKQKEKWERGWDAQSSQIQVFPPPGIYLHNSGVWIFISYLQGEWIAVKQLSIPGGIHTFLRKKERKRNQELTLLSQYRVHTDTQIPACTNIFLVFWPVEVILSSMINYF